MSGKLFVTISFTTAVVAALIIMFAGPAAATSITYSEIQTVSSPVMVGSHGQGYVMLAGAKVRDHRSCAPNCGTYNTGDTGGPYGHPNHKGGGVNNPPPLAQPKPTINVYGYRPLLLDQHGGVAVSGKQKRYNYPCLGNLC